MVKNSAFIQLDNIDAEEVITEFAYGLFSRMNEDKGEYNVSRLGSLFSGDTSFEDFSKDYSHIAGQLHGDNSST